MLINVEMIERDVRRVLPVVTDIRRYLHAHPEVSLHEFETCRYIREQLNITGIALRAPFLETDVVAQIDGAGPGRNVTLRADMDALPVAELSDIAHCSRNKNVMHACGHDGHMAMVMGAAMVLERLRDSFSGSVRFVFQPGEELVAAGKDLVQAGVLENPKADAVVALHAWAGHPVGTIGAKPGAMMAAADIFSLTIRGRGGHGSRPERTVDPILTATRIIDRLYALPSRRLGALEPVVISICSIHGGTNANVIPDEVVVQGSVRYLTRESGELLPRLFEQVIGAECAGVGASYQLDYKRPYIPMVNDSQVVAVCREVTQAVLGRDAWVELQEPSMGAEDFSYYTEQCPGAMLFIGMGEGGQQLHSNRFDFNDDALRNGILFLVHATLELLRR